MHSCSDGGAGGPAKGGGEAQANPNRGGEMGTIGWVILIVVVVIIIVVLARKKKTPGGPPTGQ